MRRCLPLAVAIAACVLPAAGSSAGSAGVGAPVYAVTGGIGEAQFSRRNPRTLGQVGPTLPLGPWESVAGLSPDGSLLALIAMNAQPASIRFLDVARMRWATRAVGLPPLGSGAVRWLDGRTIIVLGERPDGLRAVFVDAERRRIARTVRVPGHLEGQHAVPTASGLAMLLLPLTSRQIGPAVVGVLRPSGAVKTVEVERILVGSRERSRRPALIADPSASRAYVFGGLDEPVAEIDLRSLAVTYHALRGPRPLVNTLGANRFGTWLASGRIAIGGWDDSKTGTLRLGLSIVDTKTWQLRGIDRDADFFAKSGDLLLGLHLDGSLGAFGLDGRWRFDVSEPVFSMGAVASNGRYIYAYNIAPGFKGSAIVVDAKAGGSLAWPKAPPFGPVLSPGLWTLGA